MKYIILSLILLINCTNYAQTPDRRINREYSGSRLPLGYGTNHFGTSGSGIWTEIQPKLPRVDYWGVYFVNQDTGLATGEMGAIIKTTNGGQNWYTIENNYTSTIRTIGSFSGEKIIAAGDGGLIIISTDLGETWQTIESNTTKNLWNIQFVTEQTGWLVGEQATALKTTDGGNTWVMQSLPLAGYAYWDVSFLDSLFGYISANGGYILRTRNGGISWDVTQVGDNYGLFTIKAVTRQKGVALGFAGKQVNTTDGGESWQFITFLGSIFNKIAFLDTIKGFAAGYGGTFETTDGGSSWEWRMDMKDGNNITFINNETGYMVGDGLINEKTTDAGESWQRTIINDDFTDVFFTDENNGWFIGNKKLFQTTDGGETLIERNDFPGNRPSSVYFIDSLTGIVGAMNKIYKTTDGGINWEEKNISGISGNAQEYFKLFFIDQNVGWAIGFAGYVVKTTDVGENWSLQLNSGGLTDVYFSDMMNGWLSRDDGISFHKPFKTTNGGELWIEQTNLSLSNTRNVFFNDSLNGFITRSNELYHTYNGGLNFELVPNITAGLGDFSNKILEHLFLVGGGHVYFSTNAGESWDDIIEVQNRGLGYMKLINASEGYIVGARGIIYKYLDTTYTPVELASFNATIENANSILLEWNTATEINNKGFVIQRSNGKNNWKKISFVNGAGNSTEIKRYKFLDKIEKPGKYYYRLKQVDYDGSFEYSNEIEVVVTPPTKFSLEQNYPNPFNPVTTIKYTIPDVGISPAYSAGRFMKFVKLKVYNALGEEVATLVNEEKPAGSYTVKFDGSNLPSGVYIYRLVAGSYSSAKKLIILK